MSTVKKLVFSVLIGGLAVYSFLGWADQALAGPEYKWRLQSIFTSGLTFDCISKEFSNKIEMMSGGRVKISVYTGGTLCPDKEIHNALGRGQIDMATSAGAYVAGVMPEGYIEFAMPGGPRNFEEYHMFFTNFGFYKILEEAYNELGIHFLSPYAGNWRNIISKKPIRSIADLKGLKIRATGIDAKLVEKLGASTVFLPGTELYTGLALGTIDAVLFAGPMQHWDMKLMEVAKYEILPSIEMSAANNLISLKLWKSLPDDIKTIIETAAVDQARAYYFTSEIEHAACLKKMQADHGVQVITLPDSDVAKIRSTGMELLRKADGGKSARYAKAMKQLDEAMKYYLWRYRGNY